MPKMIRPTGSQGGEGVIPVVVLVETKNSELPEGLN